MTLTDIYGWDYPEPIIQIDRYLRRIKATVQSHIDEMNEEEEGSSEEDIIELRDIN